MEQAYVLAFDVGTSGIKAVLVSDRGKLAAWAEQGYPLLTPRAGWAEQDPEKYWEALCACARRVMTEQPAGRIAGISLCTQWKGIIPVDGRGRVLHNGIIWLDARATGEAAELNRRMGSDLFAGQSYWAKLLWLRRQRPQVYEQAEHILEVNSFLRWKMTGEFAADISNDFIHSPDPECSAFYADILRTAEIDPDKFPPLVDSTAQVGAVTDQAARAMGLPAGIPVFAGCSDIPAVAMGAGCGERHKVHAYFGTSGWVAAVVDRGTDYVRALSSAMSRECDVALFPMQSVGLTLNWALAQFYSVEQRQMGKDIFRLLEEELSSVPAGSERLLATPWLSGELPPLSERARVAFLNGSARHTRRHFVNAVMESICYSMRQRVEQCTRQLGRPPEELTVIGGGANSAHWMQMLADVLQIPVAVPASNAHAGAVGAARCALLGLGLWDGEAGQPDRRQHFTPRPECWEEYAPLYEAFTELYQRLEPIFTQLQA